MNFDPLQMPDRQQKPRREGLTMVMDKGPEVSDGWIDIPHEEKCNFIAELSNWGTVLSEVGSKSVALNNTNNAVKK